MSGRAVRGDARPPLRSSTPGTPIARGSPTIDHVRARRHLRKDPVLRTLIDRVGPLRLEPARTTSAFGALAESIVYQQLTGKAAATIFARFAALYGGPRGVQPAPVLATPEAQLRRAGLSRAKILAMKDLAAKTLDGTLPTLAVLRRASDEEVIAALTKVRGVGRWTAEMFLIFRLGRGDVLPIGDYGVRKGFTQTFGKRVLVTPDALARHAERWRPHRTAASWYLWRALDRTS